MYSRILYLAALLHCSLLGLVYAGQVSPRRSSPSKTGETSPSVIDDPFHHLQTLAAGASAQHVPSTSRGAGQGEGMGDSDSALALQLGVPDRKTAMNRQRNKRHSMNKKKLGHSTYFNMRPEHTLSWRPDYLIDKSRHDVHALRKKMLGLGLLEMIPRYAQFLPWKLLERVQTRREQEPELSLGEVIKSEKDKWEEEIRLMNEKDPLANRSEEDVLKAKQKALRIRENTERRRWAERNQSEPYRKKRKPYGRSQIGMLAAIPGKLDETRSKKRQRRLDTGRDDVQPNTSASALDTVKKQSGRLFDLNQLASSDD